MGDPKPLASLSSNLLARKGGAKPAMRRQGLSFPNGAAPAAQDDDLGWNDMGYDVNPEHGTGESDADVTPVHHNPLAGAIPEDTPAVKQQQEELTAKLGKKTSEDPVSEPAEPKSEKAPVPLSISREVAPLAEQSAVVEAAKKLKKSSKKSRPATKSRTRKAKAAFTLRLDAERHLRLRLATAVKNVSAQQLVTKAVDEYLRNIPELDELAERVPSRGAA